MPAAHDFADRVFRHVATSHDGRCSISSTQGGLVEVRDGATGKATRPIRLPLRKASFDPCVECLALSLDGKRVVYGTNEAVVVTGKSGDARLTALDPAVPTVHVWDLQSGHVASFKHGEVVGSVAFSPDGSRVLSGTKGDGSHSGVGRATVRLWEISSGKELSSFEWTRAQTPGESILD